MTDALAPKIRAYLLCSLSAEEEAGLEELYFADPEQVAEVWAVFADLSEQYLGGQLSEVERSQFENRLRRSPAMREMFENEKALFTYAPATLPEREREETPPAVQSSPLRSRRFDRWGGGLLRFAALSASLLLVAGLWFAWQSRRTPSPDPLTARHQDDAANKSTPQPALTPSPAPPPAATPRHTEATVATFFLSAQLFRTGADAPALTIPQQARTVRLELGLADSADARYSAALQSESNETIREWENLAPQRSPTLDKIVLRLPAALLAESSYVLKLSSGAGSEALTQQYRFVVKRR